MRQNLLKPFIYRSISPIFIGMLTFFSLLALSSPSIAQCTNGASYGTVIAPYTSSPVTIASCMFAGEYNTVTNCVAGNDYTFTASGGTGNYITIHQGTSNGPVIGHGSSPLTVTCTANGSLYVHVNTNASCGTDAACHTTTVVCSSCPPEPDPCDNIEVLNCDTPTTLSLSGAGHASWTSSPCYLTPGQEKIYSFTPIASGTATLEVISTNNGGWIDYFYKEASEGCSNTGWTCIDDFYSPNTATFTVTAGVTYYLAADSETTGSVEHTFKIICPEPTGCTNTGAYITVNAPSSPTPITIASCMFAGEYNTVTNCLAGNNYTITASGGTGNYITIHQGTYNGPIIGAGASPLTVTCTASGNLYIHVNTDASCGTDGSCHTTTIACSSCLPAPDPCDNIEDLNCDTPTTVSLSGVGHAGWTSSTCGWSTPGQEKIYSFTPTASGTAILEVISTDEGGWIDYFYKEASDGCNSTGWTCINNFYYSGSYTFTVTAGVTYYLALDAETIGSIEHTFKITCPEPTGCTNTGAYMTVDAPSSPTPITIATCMFAGEYNTVTDCVAGNEYTFTATGGTGNYITIHQGTYNGPIIGAGASPLTVTCTASGNLYVHVNTDASCGSDMSCHATTVACSSCVVLANPCDNIITMSCDTEYTATLEPNSGVWISYTDVSHTYSGSEQVFEFTAPTAGAYTFTVDEGVNDADFFFMDACNSQSNNLLGDYVEGWGGDYTATLNLNAGETVYIIADLHSSGGPTTVSVQVECPVVECLNNFVWGSTPAPTDDIEIVSFGGCSYPNESTEFTNCVQGSVYKFSSSTSGDYFTITQGSSNGIVVASGFAPLTITSPINGSLYVHVFSDDNCGDDGICRFISIKCESCPTDCSGFGIIISGESDICFGDEVTLSALSSDPNATFEWGDGSTGNQTTGGEGVYTVTATSENGSCTAQANFTVVEHAIPVVDLGGNIDACEGEPVTLESGNTDPNATVTWGDGSTGNDLYVSQSGTYSVTVENEFGCEASSSVEVTFHAIPVVDLGGDIDACEGEPVTLASGNTDPNAIVTWSDGSTGNDLSVSQFGTYSVTIENEFGCEASSSVEVTFHAIPVVDLGGEIDACEGEPITLASGNTDPNATVTWGDGSTGNDLTVTTSGTYSVTVENEHGCEASSSVEITFYDAPTVDLGDDIEECEETNVTLHNGNTDPNATVTWSDGSTGNDLTVTQAGTYSVTIENEFGCQATSSINVTFLPNTTVGAITATDNGNGSYTFSVTATNANNYSWDFGDGNTSTDVSPTHTYATPNTYHVTVTVTGDCSTETAETNVTYVTSGIADVDLSSLTLYPNPVREYITIQNGGSVEMESIVLYNSIGQVIFNGKVDNGSLYQYNVQGLATGLYHMSIVFTNGTIVQRKFDVIK